MRLFRQRQARDWEHVFAEVESELAALAAAGPSTASTPSARRASQPEDLLVAGRPFPAPTAAASTMPIPARFRDDPGLRVLAREELQDGGFEYATRRFLDEHLAPGDLLVDVGAHWGIYALSAATRWPGQVSVLAIEASPLNALHLRRWVAHNRLDEQIEVVAAGAADREGFASVAPQSTMGHHLTDLGHSRGRRRRPAHPRSPRSTPAGRPAAAARAPHLRQDRRRGARAEVIAGADQLLRSGKVAALIFEKGRDYNTATGRPRLRALCAKLEAMGFTLWRMPHENLGGPLVPLALTRDLCNVMALAPDFVRRPDYAKPFGACPAPFRLPWQPSEADLVAETEAVIAAHSVDVDRWAVPDLGQAAALRAAAAADELALASSVVDLGAGGMLLRDRLDPGCRYVPVDLFRFAARHGAPGPGADAALRRSAATMRLQPSRCSNISTHPSACSPASPRSHASSC